MSSAAVPPVARRSYRFLLRPTSKQAAALTACVEDQRALYNAALQERRGAYSRSRVSVSYGMQSAQLKDIRRDDPEGQGRWSFSSQQATLRRLDRAFQAFFRRVKARQTPGYPRFKNASRFNAVEWPKDGDGCRWNVAPESGQVRVYLRGVGQVRVNAHRGVDGTVKTVTIKREGRRWYVTLACVTATLTMLPPTGRSVGIDMGVAALATTSDGARIPNGRFGRRTAAKLAEAQRALQRCRPRSNRRRKARDRVIAVHAKIRRQRLDHAHKAAVGLVRDHDLIAHEDLRVMNLTRSASGTLDTPGTNVAQKSGLNRSILDAGWGVFLRVLARKAESAGRLVIAVDPRNTSRTCPACGHCAKENRVTQARFLCQHCAYLNHADVVGAINILRAGLARQAAQLA